MATMIQIVLVIAVFASLGVSFFFLFKDVPKEPKPEEIHSDSASQKSSRLYKQQPLSTRRDGFRKDRVRYNDIARTHTVSKNIYSKYDPQIEKENAQKVLEWR